jgi:hypothetical protein
MIRPNNALRHHDIIRKISGDELWWLAGVRSYWQLQRAALLPIPRAHHKFTPLQKPQEEKKKYKLGTQINPFRNAVHWYHFCPNLIWHQIKKMQKPQALVSAATLPQTFQEL